VKEEDVMWKPYVWGGVLATLLVLAAIAFSADPTGFPFSSRRQPSVTDIEECNEYARWIAERDALAPGGNARARRAAPLVSTGTLDGLSGDYDQDARAADAYRRCMLRRGYKAWG
jgi:hypothetical protein